MLRALPDAPLQPLLSRLGRSGNSSVSAKAWLRAADPALRDVIAKEALQYKKGHVSQVCNKNDLKLITLHISIPLLFHLYASTFVLRFCFPSQVHYR